MAHAAPDAGAHFPADDGGTYADFDFVAPKANRNTRQLLLVGLLVVVVIGGALYWFKFRHTGTPATTPTVTAVTATTVPSIFTPGSNYSDPSNYYSAKFPSTASCAPGKSTVVALLALTFASTTCQASGTVAGSTYSYQVVVIPNLPASMTAQGGAIDGGKFTVESVIQGQLPTQGTGSAPDTSALKSSNIGTGGPGGAWLTGPFVIESSQSTFEVGKVVIVGTVAFVVDAQGPSAQPPGLDYFETAFQPGSAATSTLQQSGSTGSTAGSPASTSPPPTA